MFIFIFEVSPDFIQKNVLHAYTEAKHTQRHQRRHNNHCHHHHHHLKQDNLQTNQK